MQRNLNTPIRHSQGPRWASVAIAALAMTACGPLNDDASDSTATISQATVAEPQNPVATPTVGPGQSGVGLATPETGSSAPIISNPLDPVNPQASPADASIVSVGTPATAQSPGQQTPPNSSAANTSFSGSDGTSGATPDPGAGEGAASGSAGTPVVANESIPDLGSTPAVGELGELQPLAVTGCAPGSIPPFGGEQANFITNTDVNFRAGPGSDCDLIGDGPVGANIPVTVLSGPVVREDGNAFTWVQVQILEQTGWVVLDVLEPAP